MKSCTYDFLWSKYVFKLVIEEHEGFYVVRDDLLEGGSKRRFG